MQLIDLLVKAKCFEEKIHLQLFGVFGAMWLVFIFYLFTNPDAEKPREKDF